MRRNFWKALAFCGACVLAFDSYAQTKAVYHDAGSKRITIAAAEQKLALQLDYAGGLVDLRMLLGCLMGAAVVIYAAGMAFDALRLCATER